MATLIGIEVGSRIVRAVLVRTQFRSTQVVRYVETSLDEMRMLAETQQQAAAAPAVMAPIVEPIPGLPEAAPAPSAPHDPASLPSTPDPDAPLRLAIAEVMRRAGVTSATRIADMPSEDVSLRRIELPPAALRKIDELLPFEMESLVPFDLAEAVLDYQLAEPPDPTKVRVVVCAVPRAKVRDRLDRLAAAGLDPEELIPGAAALGGLVSFLPVLASDAAQAIVHFGRARTDIAILRKGKVELARTITAGVDDLREAGFGEAPYGSSASRLAREIKQTVSSHRMQNGADVETVRVSGELDAGELLFGWLGRVLERTPIPLEMPAAPELDATLPADPVRAPAFALALGLAGQTLLKGKHLDLRKGDLAKKRSIGAIRELAPLLGVCGAFVVAAYFFSVYAHWSVLTARRAVLEAELREVSEQRLGEATPDPLRARTLLETGRASGDPLPPYDAFDALVAISGAIPDGIDHDLQRLQIDLGDDRSGGHIEMQAVVSSIEERDRIVEALGHVECFQNLEPGPMTTAGEGRRQYRLEMDLQCPGATQEGGSGSRSRRRGGARSGSSGSSGSSGGAH